jgi:hypothetical protein
VEVRELSLGSLEVVLQLPVEVLAAAGTSMAGVTVMKISKILDAIKRVAGFPAELRLQRTQHQVEALRTEAKPPGLDGPSRRRSRTPSRTPAESYRLAG